jgi:hypothetical protein
LFDAIFPFQGVVNSDDNAMLTGEGGFLYLVAHFSVSDYCNFHGSYFSTKPSKLTKPFLGDGETRQPAVSRRQHGCACRHILAI